MISRQESVVLEMLIFESNYNLNETKVAKYEISTPLLIS
jgi:hypothetical protein